MSGAMSIVCTDPDEWTPDVAEAVAAAAGIGLSVAHWRVISCWRELAARRGHPPEIDGLLECCGIAASEIQKLFPGATAAVLSRIAGLPE
jgi:sulfur relay (sulfurtransferase) DsrC/TusE family protein